MKSINGDLKEYAQKHDKSRVNSQQILQANLQKQKRSMFEEETLNGSLIQEMQQLIDSGNNIDYSNETTTHVISTLQTINKFRNDIKVHQIIERHEQL